MARAETEISHEPSVKTDIVRVQLPKSVSKHRTVVYLVSVCEIERTTSELDRQERSETDRENESGRNAQRERRREAREKDQRGGAASRGMERRRRPGPGQPGPGSESPNEKSVIIIITAERTTIINHH